MMREEERSVEVGDEEEQRTVESGGFYTVEGNKISLGRAPSREPLGDVYRRRGNRWGGHIVAEREQTERGAEKILSIKGRDTSIIGSESIDRMDPDP